MKDLKHFEIVSQGEIGRGLKTLKAFKKGEKVIEYIGEKIDSKEFKFRTTNPEGKIQKTGMTYMFHIKRNVILDGDTEDNLARLINHSCGPNCKYEIDKEKEEVFIVAKRDIEAGELLSYDYFFSRFAPIVKCKCGSEKCRGTINWFPRKERV